MTAQPILDATRPSDIVGRARTFATAAHGFHDQRRKYTGEPYIAHAAAVVEIVRTVPHDSAMLGAPCHADVLIVLANAEAP